MNFSAGRTGTKRLSYLGNSGLETAPLSIVELGGKNKEERLCLRLEKSVGSATKCDGKVQEILNHVARDDSGRIGNHSLGWKKVPWAQLGAGRYSSCGRRTRRITGDFSFRHSLFFLGHSFGFLLSYNFWDSFVLTALGQPSRRSG